jgi:hypothetical protein
MTHCIEWRLRRGDNVVSAQVTCQNEPTDYCYQSGEWDESLDPGVLQAGECLASVWINEAGAADLWYGADDTHVRSDQIDVWWDGSDWVWCYTGERPIESRLDDIAVGILDIHFRLDHTEDVLATAEAGIRRIRQPSYLGLSVADETVQE